MTTKFVLSIILLSSLSPGKNLSIRSSNFLDNIELLDVYIHPHEGIKYALVPGGLGGLNIVDLSDPSGLEVVSQYFAGGCDYGRIYAWSASENYAYGAGRECGIKVIDITNIFDPVNVTTLSDVYGGESVRYEHSEVQGNLMFAARHKHGVEIFNIDNPSSPLSITVVPTDNAWATLANENVLYVADGGFGIKVIDISNPPSANVVEYVSTTGTAKDLAKSSHYLFVASGAEGVDMFDISDPANPVFLSNYNTTGYASRVAANDSIVAVSDWDDVEVLSFTGGSLELVGYKNTGGRVMALAIIDNLIFSAEWIKMFVFEYGQVEEADIDFSTKIVSFPRVDNGYYMTERFNIRNNGLTPLIINGITMNSPDFQVELNPELLPPGESRNVSVTYTPQGNTWQSYLTLQSNDNDEETTRARVTGNFPWGPMPGDPAPDFTLPIVNGSGNLSLGDLAGQPAVIAFFTGW